MSIVTTPHPEATGRAPRPDLTKPSLRAVGPLRPDRERMRLSITRIGVASAARTAAWLSAVIAAAVVASGVVLWWVAGAAGVLGWFEEAVASGLGLDAWSLPGGALLIAWVGIAVLLALLAVLTVTLLVVAFNQIGGSVGGIDVRASARGLDDQT